MFHLGCGTHRSTIDLASSGLISPVRLVLRDLGQPTESVDSTIEFVVGLHRRSERAAYTESG